MTKMQNRIVPDYVPVLVKMCDSELVPQTVVEVLNEYGVDCSNEGLGAAFSEVYSAIPVMDVAKRLNWKGFMPILKMYISSQAMSLEDFVAEQVLAFIQNLSAAVLAKTNMDVVRRAKAINVASSEIIQLHKSFVGQLLSFSERAFGVHSLSVGDSPKE
jgi:hypothetical protein